MSERCIDCDALSVKAGKRRRCKKHNLKGWRRWWLEDVLPKCVCPKTLPRRNRCTKSGWSRCQATLNEVADRWRAEKENP